MMRGEIDFLYEVSQDAREFIEGEAPTTVFPFLRPYVYGVIFNARRDAFPFEYDRDLVRRGLRAGRPRRELLEHALGVAVRAGPRMVNLSRGERQAAEARRQDHGAGGAHDRAGDRERAGGYCGGNPKVYLGWTNR
jgi:hypothetical protein